MEKGKDGGMHCDRMTVADECGGLQRHGRLGRNWQVDVVHRYLPATGQEAIEAEDWTLRSWRLR